MRYQPVFSVFFIATSEALIQNINILIEQLNHKIYINRPFRVLFYFFVLYTYQSSSDLENSVSEVCDKNIGDRLISVLLFNFGSIQNEVRDEQRNIHTFIISQTGEKSRDDALEAIKGNLDGFSRDAKMHPTPASHPKKPGILI